MAVIAGSCGAPARAPAPADPRGAIEQRRSALTTDVAVTVLDGWGNPVAAQSIEAVDAGDNVVNSAPTDAAGHVSLAVDDGTYVFRTSYHFASYQSATCDVSAGCTSATVQIEKPVQVAVTDGYSGAVTGQAVTAINDDGSEVAWGTTDGTGVATFYLSPPGPYSFRAIAGNMYFESPPDCGIPGCVSVSIAVTTVLVTVTGTDGRPALGATVAAVDADGVEINWVGTDAQGRAAIGVPAGAFKFRVHANNDYFESGPDGHCLVGGGCTTASINVPICTGRPEGDTCDDGETCTQSETCQAGSCQAPNQPTILSLPISALGDLGGHSAIATYVNASGQAVGGGDDASGQHHAFLTSAGGAIVDLGIELGLGTGSALAISDAGTIVGSLTLSDGSHAFRYRPAGGLADLGLGGDGSSFTEPNGLIVDQGAHGFDVNERDQVAGFFTNAGAVHGFRYTDGIGFEDIGSLAGGMTFAFAINDSGTVGGNSWVPGTPATLDTQRFGHAVIFDNDAVGLVDLNDLIDPTLGWTLNSVVDMAGDFVVGTGTRNGTLRAFRLRLSTGVVDELSNGWDGRTFGTGVNSQGDAVGWGERDVAEIDQQAFIFSDRFGFKTLNDIVDRSSGWDLRVANGIGESGDIVGWGYKGGNVSAYRVRLPAGEAVTCEARNVCGGSGDQICLFSDGVVETSPGHFVAVFGFDNAASTSVHPSVNEVRIGGTFVPNPQPAPPSYLAPGAHNGAFLPTFDAEHPSAAWTVNGKTVTAYASDPHLPTVPVGTSGLGVVIGGTTIIIKPDLGPYTTPPTTEPTVQDEPTMGAPFNGALTGQFAVGPSGAATYTVPITVPPGIAGMAPNLSLVYNSQAGLGIAGQGWELSGLSIVHRCPKTRVQDGFGHQVSMDPSDKDEGVCLDGKRLFEQFGSPGTYKMELDDHSTITKIPDGAADADHPLTNVWFKVVTKTGETRYYGRNARTRVLLQDSSEVAAWALERVMDSWGNYFDVHYNFDTTQFYNDGLYVTAIDYTGHVPTSAGGAGTDPFAHVAFAYDPRRELRTMRFGSVTLPKRVRLKSITTSVDIDNVNTMAGRYYLTYAPDFHTGINYSATNDAMLPTRLTTIDYCPGQSCPASPPATLQEKRQQGFLEQLDFEWDGGHYHWDPAPDFAPPQPIERTGDNTSRGTAFLDLDGDGRLDFLRSYGGTNLQDGITYSHAWHNTGHSFEPADQWALPVALVRNDGTSTGAAFADVNGDGLPDLVSQELVHCPQPNQIEVCSRRIVVRINHIRDNNQAWLIASDFSTIPGSWNGGIIDLNSTDRIADMDGDGKVDLVRFGPTATDLQVRFSTGSGWEDRPTAKYGTASIFELGSPPISQMRLEDVNRDGLPDLVGGSQNSFCFLGAYGINTGQNHFQVVENNTFESVWTALSPPDCVHETTGTPPDKRVVGDVDGDGFRDVMSSFRTRIDNDQQAGFCEGPNSQCLCPAGCQGPSFCETITSPSPSCTCSCPTGLTVTDGPNLRFATGTSWTQDNVDPFLNSLMPFQPHPSDNPIPADARADFTFAMADLNGDGLADFILHHSNGGQVWSCPRSCGN